MAAKRGLCPLDQRAIIDRYFLEHRTKILDIAAFLDRVDRASDCNANDDFRLRAFRVALHALTGATGSRVEAVQLILSDPTNEPLVALDQKSADGAYNNHAGAIPA